MDLIDKAQEQDAATTTVSQPNLSEQFVQQERQQNIDLAARLAPEFARYNPFVRDLVRSLVLTSRRSYAPEIRAMAKRLNVRV